jgi:hypothetical protein
VETIRSVEAELLALDHARFDAMTRNDLDSLEPLLANELSYTHSTGAVESKAQYLEALRGGRVRYRAVHREVDRLTTYEDCAVMQGRLEVRAEVEHRAIVARTVFTSTWVRSEAGWQLAAWAATSHPQIQIPSASALHALTIPTGDTP